MNERHTKNVSDFETVISYFKKEKTKEDELLLRETKKIDDRSIGKRGGLSFGFFYLNFATIFLLSKSEAIFQVRFCSCLCRLQASVTRFGEKPFASNLLLLLHSDQTVSKRYLYTDNVIKILPTYLPSYASFVVTSFF